LSAPAPPPGRGPGGPPGGGPPRVPPEPPATPAPPSGPDPSSTAPTSAPEPPSPSVEPVATSADEAGRSARQEYDRRSRRARAVQEQIIADDLAWRKEIVAKRPVMGRVATAMRAKPTIEPEKQSTTAWKVGAEGEERVAEVLAGVPGIEVLHDRRVPRSRANIDHLAIGPAGVYVIDAKKYKAGEPVEVRDVGGLFRTDLRLYYGGRDRTKLVDGVLGQVEVVRVALGPDLAGVPIHGVLCFIGATWGWRLKAKTAKGVTAIWPKGLPELVARSGMKPLDVAPVAARLREALPPAGS